MQLNIPPGALQLVGIGLVLVSPITKYALTLEPCAQGADNAIQQIMPGHSEGSIPSLLQKRITRTCLAGSTLVLAAKVPMFGVFMSILGSFLTLSVSVLFPVAADLKLHGQEMNDSQKALNYATFGLGLVTAIMGTTLAVQALMSSQSPVEGSIEMLVVEAHQGVQILDASQGAFQTLVCSSLCHLI